MENLSQFYEKHRRNFIDNCTFCGVCVEVCAEKPYSSIKEVDPVELMQIKMDFLRDGKFSQVLYDSVFFCPPCLKCQKACPVGIDMSMVNEIIRVELHRQEIKAPDPIYTCIPEQPLNFFSILHSMQLTPAESRWLSDVPANPPQSDIVLFEGCLGHSQPDKILASMNILEAMGVEFLTIGGMIACCSDINSVTGDEQASDQGAKKLMQAFAAFHPKTVLLGCNTCVYRLNKVFGTFIPHSYELVGLTQFVAANLHKIKFEKEVKKRVTYQDVCKLGRGFGDWETPRQILRSIPGIDFVEMKSICDNTLCCGGVAQICEHKTTKQLNVLRMEEAKDVDAQALVTVDLGCHLALSPLEKQYGIEVINLWNVLAEAMGFEHEDKLKKFRSYHDLNKVMAEARPCVERGPFTMEQVSDFWTMLMEAGFA